MDTRLAADIDALPDGLHRMPLGDGTRSVVKRRRAAPQGFFAMEAHGLALLRETQTLRVPAVHAVRGDAIVLEDLGTGLATRADWEHAGRKLAELHRHESELFGLERDGWCGESAQSNTPLRDGFEFFAECRLLPQGRRARDAGHLSAADVIALERLCRDLRSRIPAQRAALVHGDLWLANLHATQSGELALIDAAAVHYGWPETDLAILTLFGEPPAAFFESYESEAHVDASWRSRVPLYNLYHLLNHLNLFGAGYLAGVRAVLRTA